MKIKKTRKYFGRDLEAMSLADNYHRWIVSEFEEYLGDTVAEIGAGIGNFSKLLINKKLKNLVAFEPSENMYPLLEKKLADRNNVKTLNNFLGNESDKYENVFDSVIYVNVLEHIEDDYKELSHVYKTLKNSGYVLIFVPALSWLYSDLDKDLGHFRRYYKKDIIDLMNATGFEIIKIKYFDFTGIIPWYIAFVLFKKTISRGIVSFYDRVVIPIISTLENVITPPIGKNLLLVAKKSNRKMSVDSTHY